MNCSLRFQKKMNELSTISGKKIGKKRSKKGQERVKKVVIVAKYTDTIWGLVANLDFRKVVLESLPFYCKLRVKVSLK